MIKLDTGLAAEFGPKKPHDDDPYRRDRDYPSKRIDESHTPLPGETDYSDDDEEDKQAGDE
jgi:hypothetical protein